VRGVWLGRARGGDMDRGEKYWVVEKEEERGVVERNRGEKGVIKGEYRGEWAAELSHT